jgi:hypothetical protein
MPPQTASCRGKRLAVHTVVDRRRRSDNLESLGESLEGPMMVGMMEEIERREFVLQEIRLNNVYLDAQKEQKTMMM